MQNHAYPVLSLINKKEANWWRFTYFFHFFRSSSKLLTSYVFFFHEFIECLKSWISLDLKGAIQKVIKQTNKGIFQIRSHDRECPEIRSNLPLRSSLRSTSFHALHSTMMMYSVHSRLDSPSSCSCWHKARSSAWFSCVPEYGG